MSSGKERLSPNPTLQSANPNPKSNILKSSPLKHSQKSGLDYYNTGTQVLTW